MTDFLKKEVLWNYSFAYLALYKKKLMHVFFPSRYFVSYAFAFQKYSCSVFTCVTKFIIGFVPIHTFIVKVKK